jgi:hypothetical protein
MKLNLSVLKVELLDYEIDNEDENCVEWINENIGDGDVSIREWLDRFGKYWENYSAYSGDSEFIVGILVNNYELNDEEVNMVMNEYWGSDEKIIYNCNDYK